MHDSAASQGRVSGDSESHQGSNLSTTDVSVLPLTVRINTVPCTVGHVLGRTTLGTGEHTAVSGCLGSKSLLLANAAKVEGAPALLPSFRVLCSSLTAQQLVLQQMSIKCWFVQVTQGM